MLSGRRFRLTTETLGVQTIEGKRIAVIVPEGVVIKIISGPRPDDTRMLDVQWEEKTLVMFAQDVHSRGEEVVDASKGTI
jgi:hypothetical protein